jgi:TATA-box binding protein (TBP) (component of TFIID and TFIIIB)
MAMKFRIIRICKSEAMSAVPQTPIRFDLERSSESLRNNGYEIEQNPVMIVAKKDSVEVTLYTNGRLLVTPATDKEEVRALVEGFYTFLVRED